MTPPTEDVRPPAGDWKSLGAGSYGYWSRAHRCDVFRHLGQVAVGHWSEGELVHFPAWEEAFKFATDQP